MRFAFRLIVTLIVGVPLCVWLNPPWWALLSIFGAIGLLYDAAGWDRIGE